MRIGGCGFLWGVARRGWGSLSNPNSGSVQEHTVNSVRCQGEIYWSPRRKTVPCRSGGTGTMVELTAFALICFMRFGDDVWVIPPAVRLAIEQCDHRFAT